jgi:hypothetical protein
MAGLLSVRLARQRRPCRVPPRHAADVFSANLRATVFRCGERRSTKFLGTAVMILSSPATQFGQICMSMSKTG